MEGPGRGEYSAPRGGYGQGYGTPAGRGGVSSLGLLLPFPASTPEAS